MRLLLAALATWIGTVPVGMAEGASTAQGVAQGAVEGVSLIPGWQQADGSRVAGVEIRLAPGWHTYWRAPGSAGIPPTFDWSGSANLASAVAEWPRPGLFETFGVTAIGYAGTVLLPVRLAPSDPGVPLDLDLRLDFGVCADICVPAEARLSARIAPGAAEEGRARIEAALAARAESAAEAGVARVTCTLEPDGRGFEVAAKVISAAAQSPGQVAVLEPGQPDIWIGDAMSRTEGRTVFARAPIRAAGEAGPVLEREALRLTVLDDRRAVDIRGCQAPG